MSIYAIADLHGQLPKVPDDCELLLLAGDICPDHPVGKVERYDLMDNGAHWQSEWLDTMFRAWITPVVARGCTVVAIWGNHDFVGEHKELIPDLPWILLQDSEASVNGLRIYGTPWVPGLPRWAFFASETALKARAEAIPRGLDVLMSHGPPRGAGDCIPPNSKFNPFGDEDYFVGDKALADELPGISPKLVIAGHIHEGRGKHMLEYVPVYNVSAVDEHYNLYEHPYTLL